MSTRTQETAQRPAEGRPRQRILKSALPAEADGILKITPQMRWNKRHAEARRAHHALRAAIRAGTVKREPCEICGSLRADGHHDSYDAPLVVRWLCRRHHRQLHAELRRAA